MINKKKILEELYDLDPSLKLEEEKTEKLVDFLALNNPNITAPKAFKTRLWHKLTTIWEFKQIQPKRKYSFMFFMRPLFILVVWVFILAQFKNYLSLKEVQMRTSPGPQNLEMFVSEGGDSTAWISEDEILIEELPKIAAKIIVDTESTQSAESVWNTNIASDQISLNNETQNSEQIIIEKKPSNDSNLESTELIPEKQIILDQNEIIEEWDTNTSEESLLSSTLGTSPSDQNEIIEELSWNISSATDQDTWQSLSISKILSDDEDDISDDVSWKTSSDKEYYTCENWKIAIEDSIAQRRIIKSYCDSVWGDIINNWGNIKYYLCSLLNQEEVWIEYIAEQLCE